MAASYATYTSDRKRKRQSRKQMRRRSLLCALLGLAFSPTLVALYIGSLAKTSSSSNNDNGQSVNHVIAEVQLPILSSHRTLRTGNDDQSSHSLDSKDDGNPHDGNRDSTTTTALSCTSKVCCWPWSVSTDAWWQHHPLYQVGPENRTHTCLTRFDDAVRAAYVQRLHERQWHGNCDAHVQAGQISSGFAAALQSVARSFAAASDRGVPFQYNRRHEQATWNFANSGDRHHHHHNASHWADCATHDLACYYLPLGACPPEMGRHDAPRGTKPSAAAARLQFAWLRAYAFRPRHMLRHALYVYQQQMHVLPDLPMSSNCTAIHVRRGDVAFGKGRRYAAVDEYLRAGEVAPGATVVVLTDDQSTVDEINLYLQHDYQFIMLDRPRTHGTDLGFEGFIPADSDPATEVLAILAEVQMASQCRVLVHGKSGFVALLDEAMLLRHGAGQYKTITLNIQQDKALQPKLEPAVRAQQYWQAIRAHYEGGHDREIPTVSSKPTEDDDTLADPGERASRIE